MTTLLTTNEAAEKLRMLTARVTRLAKRGEMPCVVLPDGEYRFDPADLEQWVAGFKHPAKGGSIGPL